MPLLVTLAIACFAGAVSIRVIDPVVADMARDWAVTPAVIALLASAFAFPYALSQPLLGPAGDAYGKSRVIKIGLGVLAVATVVVAVAPTLEMMFIARAVAGVAGGAIIPVALATVGDRVPFAERQVALSHILSAMLVAQLVSLTGSGLIAIAAMAADAASDQRQPNASA
ncbi:MAG: MFS transporter, partial [Pseudomonadota bacterium]